MSKLTIAVAILAFACGCFNQTMIDTSATLEGYVFVVSRVANKFFPKPEVYLIDESTEMRSLISERTGVTCVPVSERDVGSPKDVRTKDGRKGAVIAIVHQGRADSRSVLLTAEVISGSDGIEQYELTLIKRAGQWEVVRSVLKAAS